jgi:hypothetical protein
MSGNVLHNLDGCFKHDVPAGSRRIAWDAVSFCVPSNWELAVYKSLRRGAHRVEIEDEYSIRLESEWIRGHRKLNLSSIMKRYEKASKPLTLKSDEQKNVGRLPEGWHATHFIFKETVPDQGGDALDVVKHELVTAFYLCPLSSIFCFFLLHFMPEDKEKPADVIRRIASTFQNHSGSAFVPWQLFDIAIKVPREFVLESTQFDIGVKLMVFKWKLRRYFLWHFSCADVFLKDGASPAEWACGYMNGARLLKGPVFYPDGKGGIGWRRRRPYLFGHREEIATLCYRYAVGCRLSDADNKLVLWVYHYRREDDLKLLPNPD